ncbi:MAG: peroxiredoxin [Pseudanabaenaceae cyanobacterium]
MRLLLPLALIATIATALILFSSNSAYALGGKQPDIGQPAPEFTLPSFGSNGKDMVSLKDFRGKWVVLYFYPKDFTAGCTIEARRFQQDLPKFQARNAQILGVSADSVDSHQQFCNSEGLKFPLLADQGGTVSQAYGSWLGFISLRHTFLIDPDGILREKFLNVNPATHSQEVLDRLAYWQSQA